MADEKQFDLDLSATTHERVVIGKVKLSDDPERIVDIYSPDTQEYARLMAFQRRVAKLIPLMLRIKKGEEITVESVDPEELELALGAGDEIMKIIRPLMPDVKPNEEIDIAPEKAAELLSWVLTKSANQKPSQGEAEKKTTRTTNDSQTKSPTSVESTPATN